MHMHTSDESGRDISIDDGSKTADFKRLIPGNPKIYLGAVLILITAVLVFVNSAQNSCAVHINDKKVAVVESREVAEKALENVVSEAGEGKEVNIDGEITYEKTHTNEELVSQNELEKIFGSNLDFLSDAAAIVVNDKEKIWLKSEKSAEQVLDKLKEHYKPEGDELTELSMDFKENVSLKSGEISLDKLSSREEALLLLKEGTTELVTYEVEEGDTLWTIADHNDLKVEEILEANPSLNEESTLSVGDTIKLSKSEPLVHVVATYQKTTTEEIPYETDYVSSSELWEGTRRVTKDGKKGEKEVVYKVTEENGEVVDRQDIDSKVIKEPTNQVVARGTKSMVASRGNGGSGRLAWPIRGRITSGYGYRGSEFHAAIDIDGSTGQPIGAAEDGQVCSTGSSGGYGNMVTIDHGNGLMTKYAHLSQINVNTGQNVSRGQTIGKVGSTGRSTGPHLHFEVLVNGSKKNPFDYLN